MNKKKTPLLSRSGVQSLLSSLLCILIGLLVGYLVLLIINPSTAWDSIVTILKNFMNASRAGLRMKNLGNTIVKTVPLLMCSLSILFAYKTGLFNIGAAGQYVVGAGAGLYCALGLHLPWYLCLLASAVAGAALAAISGALKAYCNVNEVISCIMLNWISLYGVNALLRSYCPPTGKDTFTVASTSPNSLLPTVGLDKLFNNNKHTTIAIPLSLVLAVVIWVIIKKTKLGYELRATGLNKNAAKYCGMKEKRNIILTMAIAGALAGLGAGFLFLSDFEQWPINGSSVPAMGFNGIAAAFLGGLDPIGVIFSSYFIQHITIGGANVNPAQISDLISSLIIYLCGFVLFFKQVMGRRAKAGDQPAVEETPPAQPAVDTEAGEGGEK